MKKDEAVLTLFYNQPTRHWHFEEILREAYISRPQAAQWLKHFEQEKVIKKIKQKWRMPYYVADYESSAYQARKKLFALNELEKKSFLSHLAGLPKARAVILFGSMSRWDWNRDSDIDVFIYGDSEGFDKVTYRSKLHREIETFVCRDERELKKLGPAFLRNIVGGYIVKGTLDFVEVAHA